MGNLTFSHSNLTMNDSKLSPCPFVWLDLIAKARNKTAKEKKATPNKSTQIRLAVLFVFINSEC